MADKKKRALSDEDLVAKVDAKVQNCATWDLSKLSTERRRIINYYNSKLPRRQHDGSSSYVSSDVYDSVEAMKSQLLETFAANDDSLVTFPAQGPEDVENSRVATEYCSYQIHRLNEGYDIFSHAIHDGLTARVGVTKLFWEKIEDEVEEEFSNASFQDVQALAAQPDITDLNADADEGSADPTNPTFYGTITRKVDRSKVTLLAVPPEEFLIDIRAKCIDKASIVVHRTLKTRAELKDEMGYDPAKVDAVQGGDEKTLEFDSEEAARTEAIGPTTANMDDPIQRDLEKLILFEAFVRMDMRDGRGVRLWKICYSGNQIFEKEEVDRAPFLAFVPLPVPHCFFGNNFAQRVVPTQNARTVLTRAILDHASVTTNPRWGVLKGGLSNPKEMLENRLGGIVNFNRPDAVKPLDQHNLNPFVFQTLEMLKQNKEESTGISALSQGMNKDAISTQNSAALVDNLVTLSQQRQKIIARNFAVNYLIPLYLEVYRLVLENEKTEKIIEVTGGRYVKVSPESWIERKDCKVALHLGYGEKDRQTAKFTGLYQQLAADPAMGPMFTPANRYKLATDGMKSAQFENWNQYLTSPDQIQPPPPDPIKMKELEIEDKKAEAALITAKATAMKHDRMTEIADLKEQIAELKLHSTTLLQAREQDRKEAETANKIDVAQRETALLEAAPPAAETAMVSPS